MFLDESELNIVGNLSYEKRIVSYFDVLGWRQEIEDAGIDTRRIARLAVFTRMFQAAIAAASDRSSGAQISTFSDNVVMSIPFNPGYLEWWTRTVAGLQLALGLMGFWVRGAVTIGNLFHDSYTVFGPALNRAYELESKEAIYPRILLDSLVPELAQLQTNYTSRDERHCFIDPFTVEFAKVTCETQVDQNFMTHFNQMANTEIVPTKLPLSGRDWLAVIYLRLLRESQNAATPKVQEKYIWLLNRIAPRIGHPMSA